MHIIYLIDNLLRAGTQTALGHLVRGLATRGFDQQIFCLNKRFVPEVVAGFERDGASVEVIGKTQLVSGYGLGRLFGALRRTDVLQTFLPASDIIGRAAGRLAGVPLIVTSIRARNIDKTPFQLWLDRRTMHWAHRVVFNAKSVVDFSIKNEGVRQGQVVVVPNGVSVEAPSGVVRSILSDWVPENAAVIGTVGRLRPQKNHATLIKTLGLIRDETDAHLLLIGEGELRGTLESQVQESGLMDRVHFLGVRTDLPDLFAVMDVYAHPSKFEGMPNAVMEAMAAGLPVVATDIDGTRELINDGETGWLTPVGDAHGLAQKILTAIKEPERSRRIGAAAARFMAAEFSVEKMVDGFEGVYRGEI